MNLQRCSSARFPFRQPASAASRLAYHQFGFEHDRLGIRLVRRLDAPQQQLCGDLAHSPQRLADGGQAGRVVHGAGDVVEADDGDVAGAGQASIHDGTHRAQRSNVVEAENRGEVACPG